MKFLTIAAIAVTAALPLAAHAEQEEDVLQGRQGYIKLLSLNMAPLAAMAKGEIDYDEAAASKAAANIEALTKYDIPPLFIEGTANGEMEGSDALPAIWEKPEDFAMSYAALGEAASGASEAVKGGQANIGPVLQKLGGACKDCHDSFRKK